MSEAGQIDSPRAVVLQITPRRDFAVARALEDGGALALMATDLTVPSWMSGMTQKLRRYTAALPSGKVTSAPVTGLLYRAAMKISGAYKAWPHSWVAQQVTKAKIATLKRQQPNIVFGLDTSALELFESFDKVRPRPRLVLEQCVAPRQSQRQMFERLAPFFSKEGLAARLDYAQQNQAREEREWTLADVIIVPSAYVAEELEKAGCDPAKIRLVPYGYTPDSTIKPQVTRDRSLPLRGLFVGGVDHRKGVHDIAAIAKTFEGRIEFDVFGKFIAGEDDISEWGKSLTLHGPQPFERVKEAYQQSDFLILPSYLEGSAMVVYEAMAYGLPCIVTRETGSIITHRENGFIINAGDRDELAATLEEVVNTPSMLNPIAEKAAISAGTVSDKNYSERLMAAIVS